MYLAARRAVIQTNRCSSLMLCRDWPFLLYTHTERATISFPVRGHFSIFVLHSGTQQNHHVFYTLVSVTCSLSILYQAVLNYLLSAYPPVTRIETSSVFGEPSCLSTGQHALGLGWQGKGIGALISK